MLKYRLESEYKVELRLKSMPFSVARWVRGKLDASAFDHLSSTKLVEDREGRPVLLFERPWSVQYVVDKFPDLELLETGSGAVSDG